MVQTDDLKVKPEPLAIWTRADLGRLRRRGRTVHRIGAALPAHNPGLLADDDLPAIA